MWSKLIKDGWFIQETKYTSANGNKLTTPILTWSFVKGETQSERSLKAYLSFDVVQRLIKMGAPLRKARVESSALNYHPRENKPQKGMVLHFEIKR